MFDIKKLTQQICQSDPQLTSLQSTVEKELLHYEIMAAMSKYGFLSKLTFQGGTCLRMMYGSNRLSEDLDFAGGLDFNFKQLEDLRDSLQFELGKRHNLKINVTQPDFDKLKNQANIKVGRWKVSIETEPQHKSAPWQKINLEVANVPAHTSSLRPMTKTYPQMPDGYQSILLNCESLEEIAADKFVALALRRSIKARDVWDLTWLKQQQVEADPQLVNQKFDDYQSENGIEALESRLKTLPVYMRSGDFENEMERFLMTSVATTSIRQAGFNKYVEDTVTQQGRKLLSLLEDQSNVHFKM